MSKSGGQTKSSAPRKNGPVRGPEGWGQSLGRGKREQRLPVGTRALPYSSKCIAVSGSTAARHSSGLYRQSGEQRGKARPQQKGKE